MIPQPNLSLFSNRLFREQGGRRIPEAVLQRDLPRVVPRNTRHASALRTGIQGGTALRRCQAFQGAGKGQMASYQRSWQHKPLTCRFTDVNAAILGATKSDNRSCNAIIGIDALS
jgi:hypothetical protein